MDRKMTLGERLKHYRTQNGYRQSDIAEILNVHRTAYTYYEADKTEPDLAKLKKLAELYKIDLIELLSDSKSRSELLADSRKNIAREAIFPHILTKTEAELVKAFNKLSEQERNELLAKLKKQTEDKQ